MAGRILAALIAACLAGCGGSADEPGKPVSLVAIGNSITWIAETHTADFVWSPGRGLAASSLATDYVHMTAAAMRLPVAIQRNVASLELPANDPINTIDSATPLATQISSAVLGIDASSLVIVELGDNAWRAPSAAYDKFVVNYAALLDAVSADHPRALVCVSTWWIDPIKDAMIEAACKAHGGRYVFIGDIYPARTEVIPAGEDPRFAGHPHDPSMAEIAKRITAVL